MDDSMLNNNNQSSTSSFFSKRPTIVQIDKSVLHCKNGCGFYGNREWDGYCSICYKEVRYYNQQQQQQYLEDPMSLPPLSASMISSTARPVPPSSPITKHSSGIDLTTATTTMMNRAHSASTLSYPTTSAFSTQSSNNQNTFSFRKFEEKKRQQSDKKSLKSIFKRASTFREYRSSSATSSSSTSSQNTGDSNSNFSFFSSLEKPLQFGEEVLSKLFSDHAIRDINSNVTKCVEKCHKLLNRGCTIDELTELIHDFYAIMENRFQTFPQYKESTSTISQTQLNQFIDQTEKILMDKLYLSLFTRVQNEEEERDLELQKKIRNLNWIMSNHLDIDINLRHPKVKDLMDQAINEIIELDSKKVPYEKLDSIVRCSKTIFEMLQIDNNAAISADQFLPALVFIIINANPPLLQSNIKFITRFSTPSRLMTGEAGYYFTNLCCATQFIEKISGESLNMNEEDFQRYINGEAQPPGYYRQSFLCEPFRMLSANHTILNDTAKRSNEWINNIQILDDRLNRFEENLQFKCRQAINSSSDMIEQHRYYKIFEQINDDQFLLLPKNFQELRQRFKSEIKEIVGAQNNVPIHEICDHQLITSNLQTTTTSTTIENSKADESTSSASTAEGENKL